MPAPKGVEPWCYLWKIGVTIYTNYAWVCGEGLMAQKICYAQHVGCIKCFADEQSYLDYKAFLANQPQTLKAGIPFPVYALTHDYGRTRFTFTLLNLLKLSQDSNPG